MLGRFNFSCLLVALSMVGSIAMAEVGPNTYFFPQTAVGTAGDQTILTQFSVYNPRVNDDAHIQMSFFKNWVGQELLVHTSSPNDETLAKDGANLSFVLSGQKRYVINVTSAGGVQAGWTKVLSDLPLQISASYGAYQQRTTGENVPIWEAAVLPAEPAHELSLPVNRIDDDAMPRVSSNMGFGIANISEWGTAHVTARLYNADGSFKAEQEVEVRQHGHKAQFVTELFSGVSFTNFRGMLKFSSNAPIVVVALKESKNGASTVYSTVPVQRDSTFRTHSAYELEENTSSSPHVISAPAEIQGTINANFDGNENDFFAIDLNPGQTVQAIVLTSFTGSPVVPDLRISSVNLTAPVIGQPIMAGSSDACVTHTATASGRYNIVMSSDNGFGRGFTYRLFVRVF